MDQALWYAPVHGFLSNFSVSGHLVRLASAWHEGHLSAGMVLGGLQGQSF